MNYLYESSIINVSSEKEGKKKKGENIMVNNIEKTLNWTSENNPVNNQNKGGNDMENIIENAPNWEHPNYHINNDNLDSGINLEEEFQKNSEKEHTALQKKFLNACGDISEEFKQATFIECLFKVGTRNGTPYLVMRYKYTNEDDKYIEDNFYLSDNAYQHNLERLDSVLHIMGGKLELTNTVNENALKEYINKFKGTEVLISQFRNKEGHKLCNVASLPKEVE